AHGQHDPDVVQPRLILRMYTDMRLPVLSWPRFEKAIIAARECLPENLLDRRKELLQAPGIEHVLKARFGAVGAITFADEYAYDGVRDLGCVGRPHDNAGITGEVLVARDAAQHEPKPDAGIDRPFRRPRALEHFDCLEANVVSILQRGDLSTAIEGDVEFAGHAVERP